ncbi:MAG: hypothetical protein ACREXK_13935 [Gammaproteobacteria bacterium]
MKIKTAIVAGLLCATGVAGAVDPQEVVDPAGALEGAAKDAVIEKATGTTGLPDDALDKAKDTREAVEGAQETAADPDAAMERLKGQATDTAIEKAKGAIPTPTVPEVP